MYICYQNDVLALRLFYVYKLVSMIVDCKVVLDCRDTCCIVVQGSSREGVWRSSMEKVLRSRWG